MVKLYQVLRIRIETRYCYEELFETNNLSVDTLKRFTEKNSFSGQFQWLKHHFKLKEETVKKYYKKSLIGYFQLLCYMKKTYSNQNCIVLVKDNYGVFEENRPNLYKIKSEINF